MHSFLSLFLALKNAVKGAALSDKAADSLAQSTKIDWQRQATIELPTQQHPKAIDRYHDTGHIHPHQSRQEAINRITERWFEYTNQHPHKSTIMMAYRGVDVLTMNLLASDKLIAANLLHVTQPSQIETAKFGALEFAVGEQVMFLRNEKSLHVKNGMLQKPAQKDDRWLVNTSLETALVVVKACPDARISILANIDQFENNPLEGKNRKKLILCVDENTPSKIINKAVANFSKKGFIVAVARSELNTYAKV